MIGLAEIAERGRKIARPDKHPVDALDPRNSFEVLKSALRLHLQQQANLSVGRRVIAFDPAVARGARLRGEAAKALRGIAGRLNRTFRFLLRFDIGNEKLLGADVEQALDDHLIVPRRSDDRMGRSAAHRLKLSQHHRQFVRRVLGVDQNPVEPRIGEDFDDQMADKLCHSPICNRPDFSACLKGFVSLSTEGSLTVELRAYL